MRTKLNFKTWFLDSEIIKPAKGEDVDEFKVIRKNKVKADQIAKTELNKAKDVKPKPQRTSVKEHLKTAKRNKEVPMTFCEMKDDAPKPKHKLQRTPPKANKNSPNKDNAGFGGGLMCRDDPVSSNTTRQQKGPVQRSPPRKAENNTSDRKKVEDDRNYDYLDNIKIDYDIERKDKIRRSPVDPMRNKDSREASPVIPKTITEKRVTSPMINLNPLKSNNEYTQNIDYMENYAYDQSPQKKLNYEPQTQKAQYDNYELTYFEDKVDNLL